MNPSGSDGWDRTGAITAGSGSMARAKLPVKHMPTTPDAGSAEPLVLVAGQRLATTRRPGWSCPVAQAENSFDTHAGAMALMVLPTVISAPGTPKRWGTTAVHPSSTTRSAKSSTFGVMPGISAKTSTAGPSPLRYTSRVLPANVNVSFS